MTRAGTQVAFLDAGDQAFTISLGEVIDSALVAEVAALDARISAVAARGGLPGLVETVPTFRSLTLIYDPLQTTRGELQEAVRPMLRGDGGAGLASGRGWRLPVCYGGAHGPDLAATARSAGVDEATVIALHHERDYRVYMLGFLPGFPFIGDVAEPLRLPRHSEPRPRVTPGSVAIAGGLTAIYPSASPGGWHLLGRCPVPLFDVASARPSLLQPGDRVRFVPVDADEFVRLERALADGALPREHFAEGGDAA